MRSSIKSSSHVEVQATTKLWCNHFSINKVFFFSCASFCILALPWEACCLRENEKKKHKQFVKCLGFAFWCDNTEWKTLHKQKKEFTTMHRHTANQFQRNTIKDVVLFAAVAAYLSFSQHVFGFLYWTICFSLGKSRQKLW